MRQRRVEPVHINTNSVKSVIMVKRNMPSAAEPTVYGTVTVGDRGQVVIPKGARDSVGIRPGDKLIVLKMHGDGIALLKTDALKEMARKLLSQVE